MKYKYIYLNTCYLDNGRLDPNEYNAICLRDAEKLDNVQVVQTPLDYSTTVIRRLYNLTRLIDRKFKLNITKLWFPFLIKSKFDNSEPYCFVVSSYNLPLDYFLYLRKKYPGCKIIKIYRDLTQVIARINPNYSPEIAKRYFDYLMTFDNNEADSLGMIYFNEIESEVEIKKSNKYPISDVFIAARAKDRLSKIIRAYEIFTNAGLTCDFYLTGVKEEERIPRIGITYADKNMPYMEMLFRSVNSRCMFDINQGGAVGYTSRFLEAVMYNKKIITDNPFVMKSKYYNPNYIQYIETVEKIDPSFVNNDVNVNFAYDGEFSPINLINQIERLLVNE